MNGKWEQSLIIRKLFSLFRSRMLLRIVLVVLLVTLANLVVSGFIILQQAPMVYSRYRYTVPFSSMGGVSSMGGIGGGPMLLYTGDIDWNT